MKRASMAAGEARRRAAGYACLARVFGALPTEETVQALREIATDLRIAGATEWPLPDLKREYVELFVIPNARYVAPYETAFRDEPQPPACSGSAIGGESALAVGGFYLETGMPVQQDTPDHLANELSFLAYAWSKQAQAVAAEAERWRHLRAEFRREHLLPWVGRLSPIVSQRDRLGYYRLALRVAETLLRHEEQTDLRLEARNSGGARAPRTEQPVSVGA